jgi:hypothetical protein
LKKASRYSPSSIFLPYFAPAAFYLFLKVKSELEPGHLQEELEGGRPHQRYRRACAAAKNTHIADGHAKK